MKRNNQTKEKVLYAAATLFNNKGFDGTSVREIAQRADVNSALISYYFGSKKGLLEHMMTTFFEGYLRVIDESYTNLAGHSPKECLLDLVAKIMHYQQANHHLSRFIHREISLDNVLVREVMSTYLAKEKYYFKSLFESGMERKQFRKVPVPYTILQLKGMLAMPYLHPQYIVEVLHIYPHEPYFTKRYIREISSWIEESICLRTPELTLITPSPKTGMKRL